MLLAAQLLLIRSVGAAEAGRVFLFIAVVGTFALLLDLGVTLLLEKGLSQPDHSPYLLTVIMIRLTTGLLLGLALALVGNQVVHIAGFDNPAFIILGVVLNQLGSIAPSALNGLARFRALSILDLSTSSLQAVGLTSAGFLHLGHVGIDIAYLVGYLPQLGLLVMLRPEWGRPRIAHIREAWPIARFGILLGPSALAYRWIPTLVLGMIRGPATVADYEIALSISGGLLIVSNGFGTILLPAASRMAAEARFDEVRKALGHAFVFSAILVVPATVFAAILLKPVSQTAGINLSGTLVATLTILAMERYASANVQAIKRVLFGTGDNFLALAVDAAAGIVIVAIVLPMVALLGAVGAPVAVFAGTVVSLTIAVIVARRRHLLQFPYMEVGLVAAASIFVASVVLMFVSAREPSVPSAIAAVLIFAVGYLGAILLLRPTRRHVAGLIPTRPSTNEPFELGEGR